jgi:alpha-L-fucosidase 2
MCLPRFALLLLFSSLISNRLWGLAPILILPAPITTWEKGIPLGNGETGGMLWGEGTTVNLSLDRGDLWDLRTPEIYKRKDWNYATLERLVRAGDEKQIHALFDDPYDEIAYPTKLPAGRLVLSFPQTEKVNTFSLDTHRAEATVGIGAHRLTAFFSATTPVALLRISGTAPMLNLDAPSGVQKLGYPSAHVDEHTIGDTHSILLLQQGADGFRYAVVVASRQQKDETTIAVAIVSSREGKDPVAIGLERTSQALASGYDAVLADHLTWWRQFGAISDVRVPDADVQKQYNLDRYFYGAASRKGAPPMPLQGVWTADEGGLPPWKGDYHNDLNTQMMYIAAPEAGLFEQSESFLDFNWKLLPVYRSFAHTFYNVPGAVVPGVEALDGQPLGGWSQYSFSPTMGAWVAQSFYLQWRYTMDPIFLRTRAYPFTEQIGIALESLLKPGADGKLKLPLSSSPEFFDNSMQAWLPPNSNFDLAQLRWLYGALAEMATTENNETAAAHWHSILRHLDNFSTSNGQLMLAPGVPFTESHRHLSHLMAIHPLGILTIDGDAQENQLINRSVDSFLSRGTKEWTGYTYSWVACMLARIGRADQALQYLHSYLRGFIYPNGFHVNGDQSGTDLSDFHYHPFTLEGNFLAMQAVQEMLLQSWGGKVRIFPAVPSTWKDVSFKKLHAEGGYIVSAKRTGGHTTSVTITATADGILRLPDPFDPGAHIQWNRPIRMTEGQMAVHLHPYETLRGEILCGNRQRNGRALAIVVHQHLFNNKFDMRDNFLLRRDDLRPIRLDTDRDGSSMSTWTIVSNVSPVGRW